MQSSSVFRPVSVSLETVLGPTSHIPETLLPEYAFVGRSNVGKSSLINMLLGRKSFARVSSSPGKTRTINYYRVNDALYFVDLPGYGYADVSKKEKESFGRLAAKYLEKSSMLQEIFLLVDMRRKPSQDDLSMYEWIRFYGFRPIVLMTKADKLGKNEKPKAKKLIRETLSLEDEARIIECSAVTKAGRDEIYKLLS